MSKKTLDYRDYNRGLTLAVMVCRIVRFSKGDYSESGAKTFIHLDNEEILESSDSIKTLQARIEVE